jgi:hypothetical protein
VVAAEEAEPPRLREPARALAGTSYPPRVAVGAAAEAMVTWRQGDGREGRVFRSVRAGAGTWVDPAGASSAVSFAPDAYEPVVVIGADGEVLHAWNQWKSPGYGIALARRAPGAAAFEEPAGARDVLSPDLFFSNLPLVARNDRGDAVVSWYQSTGAALRVYASERFGPNGRFSRPSPEQALSPEGGAVEGPAPAVAPSGEAAVAWQQEPPQGGQAVYLALRDRAGRWTLPAGPFAPPADDVGDVRVAYAPSGELHLVWQEKRGQAIAVMAAARAPDGHWSAPAALSQPGVRSIEPELAVGADLAVVVHVRLDPDGWKIVARRRAAGTWSEPEVLSAAGGNAAAPTVAIGGADRAVAAWTQDGRIHLSSFE